MTGGARRSRQDQPSEAIATPRAARAHAPLSPSPSRAHTPRLPHTTTRTHHSQLQQLLSPSGTGAAALCWCHRDTQAIATPCASPVCDLGGVFADNVSPALASALASCSCVLCTATSSNPPSLPPLSLIDFIRQVHVVSSVTSRKPVAARDAQLLVSLPTCLVLLLPHTPTHTPPRALPAPRSSLSAPVASMLTTLWSWSERVPHGPPLEDTTITLFV